MIETICEIFKEGYKRGWITARDGNASVRYKEQNYFFITPSGVRKQFLQPEMFLKVSVDDKNNHQSLSQLGESLRPSGELPLHHGLQKEIDTDIRVALHMHPTYTVAALYKRINLQQLLDDFPELSRYTSVAPSIPLIPPVSEELAKACIENLQVENGKIKYNIIGMDRHGVVAVDTSPWRAFEHIERLEHISKIVLESGRV